MDSLPPGDQTSLGGVDRSLMSRRGQAENIRDLPWQAAEGADPIEVFTRRDLIARFPEGHFDHVERLQFHLVLIGDSGEGRHEVDFVDTQIRPNRVVHIEPGQVQRWRSEPQFDATLVLFPEVPSAIAPSWGLGPRAVDLTPAEMADVRAVLALIGQERSADRTPAGRDIALRGLRDLLLVRLGLDRDRDAADGDLPPVYVAFRNDLEAHLTVEDSMGDRAKRIGYSGRTISRACLGVSGRTAKQLADDRLVLEARRLLAQPGASVAQVARALGFTEQTNFAKYFRRHTGVTPSAWVETIRSPT